MVKVVLVTVMAMVIGVVNGDQCEWKWDDMEGLTYDLTPLQLKNGGQLKYYTVKDSRMSDSTTANDFIYVFNICNTILDGLPTECKGQTFSTCTEKYANNNSCKTSQTLSLGYAYQMRFNGSAYRCHELSNSVPDYTKVELLDDDEPAKGVVLRYTNGEWCTAHSKNREFQLKLECENDYYNIPDEEPVYEDLCVYSMNVKSIHGCPTQCGIYSNSLCGGNGMCSFDWTNLKAGCFCYWNRGGQACEEETGTGAYTGVAPKQVPDKYTHTFTSKMTWVTHTGVEQEASVNVTYDYSLFHLAADAYTVSDVSRSFVYYWNFLGSVPSNMLPDSCKTAIGPCESLDNCDTVPSNGDQSGSVFQINTKNDNCNLLARGSDYTWQLYDSQHPGQGVTFTYRDGGYCSNEKQNRHFTINFICPASAQKYSVPEDKLVTNSSVYEEDDHKCSYILNLETAVACPYQCLSTTENGDIDGTHLYTYSVCNGRGICAADPIAHSVRCLCDSGYQGSLCESVISTKSSTSSGKNDNHVGFQVAISIVTILVLIFVAASVYLYLRNRTLEKFRGQLLEDEADEVVSPHQIHTEPKVPDDIYDASDSEPEAEDEENEENNTTETQGKPEDAPSTELTSIEKPQEAPTNVEIKLEGPPST